MINIGKLNIKFKSKTFACYFIGVLLLFNGCLYFASNSESANEISKIQSRNDASGFSHIFAQKFVYFYYYTGDFPLGTLNENLVFTKEGALQEIETNGDSLIMEYFHWSRLGESARILAYLPNAWVSGSPQNPSIKLFNTIVFVISLIVCFLGFWQVEKPVLGIALVLAINCTPFFIYEIYVHQNVFGLMGSLFFMILGINLPMLYIKNYKRLYKILGVIISVLLIAFLSEIRNEITAVFIAFVAMIILFDLSRQKLFENALLAVLSILMFAGVKKGIQSHFSNKFDQTIALVSKKGGHPYLGDRIKGHKFWHPVFCGLGDFDDKYGYEWNDRAAYNYAVPKLNEEYNMNISYSGQLHTDDYYDSARLYYKKFDEIPEYEEVVKEKVITDISKDPLWYLKIIVLRVITVLSVTLPIPYLGWAIFPLLYYLIKYKKWNLLKLLIVSLPLSITSILIYSGKGATYNAVYVYVMLVIMLEIVLQRIEKEKKM